MTDLFVPLDTADRDLALGATGLLDAFNEAGVLTSADVHVATTLGTLLAESDETVLLAAALATRAVRHGSICVELGAVADGGPDELAWPEPTAWTAAVAASPLVAEGVLRLEGGLLYLDRYHQQETQVLDDLARRAATAPDHDPALAAAALDRVFGDPSYAEQHAAGTAAVGRWTTVLTGGPGTGKTTAVAGLLVALHEQAETSGGSVRIALAAPTGRAAAQLQSAVDASAARFSPADAARVSGLEAMTLHRLLGRRPGNATRFRHHRGNKLPHDVVVVDETSMVSLTMMARLLEAVRPDARLVLVGDPDQLASVEAGAVLSDLVHGYDGREDSPVAALRTTHRFGGGVGRLAAALRGDDVEEVLAVLGAGLADVVWVSQPDPTGPLRTLLTARAQALRSAAASGPEAALADLAEHRLLCAHRDGPRGVHHWNRRVEQWLAEGGDVDVRDPAYVGRPLLVTANDHVLGVYNGDSGVVVATPEGPRVALPAAAAGAVPRTFATSRLGDVDTMHAMTIHKAQGSQAREVTVLLPEVDSRLLTRELLYTAVTRAQERVRVVGTEEELRAAFERRVQRASGLRDRIASAGRDR
ncbi:MAG: exodeoxyribonuclease V subunit alpha [Nocardioides sp.]|uniref:exodeoxyribonuclease V subunit alpha n=1 Tax=Nocardioides sp. TaxID=35761 RepID=UPI003F080E74